MFSGVTESHLSWKISQSFLFQNEIDVVDALPSISFKFKLQKDCFQKDENLKRKYLGFLNLGKILTILPTYSTNTQNSSNSIWIKTHSLKVSIKVLIDADLKDRRTLIFPFIKFLTGCNSQLNHLFKSHGILTVTFEGGSVDLNNTTSSHFLPDGDFIWTIAVSRQEHFACLSTMISSWLYSK